MVAAGIGAGFAIGGTKSSGRVIGANDTIRIGVAGLQRPGRIARRRVQQDEGGRDHLPDRSRHHDVREADQADRKKRRQHAQDRAGHPPRARRQELDAISVATPNHWHSLITIWGCQAGKDVYVEKPCSHNVHEGRIAVEAARKYDRIVQHGTQSRSARDVGPGRRGRQVGQVRQAARLARALLQAAQAASASSRTPRPPRTLDYNLWLGPAPEHAVQRQLVHYNWHWFWDFGNGDIGNQGVHQMDIARWMIPRQPPLPKSVVSLGGRFGYTDQGETPNTQIALMDFGDTQLIFEVRGLKTDALPRARRSATSSISKRGRSSAGNKFYPKGKSKATRRAVAQGRGQARAGRGRPLRQLHRRRPQPQDRRPQRRHPRGPLLRRPLPPGQHLVPPRRAGPVQQPDQGLRRRKEAYETLERMEEYLTKNNGLKLDGLDYRLGRKLTVDAKTESFVDAPEANKLLTRPYRKPFVVPESLS